MISSWDFLRNYVKLTHLPTGFSATSNQYRSQHRNRDSALQRLKSLLYAFQLGITPSKKVIRTYTLPEGDEYPDDIMKYSREVKYDESGRVTFTKGMTLD